jgi:hypothetical protein
MEIVENYLGIKNRIKTKYGLDIVITQSWRYFEALEEDADSLEREFAWNKHQRGGNTGYYICSAPASGPMEDFLVRKFQELGFSFAILRLKPTENNEVVREVVRSTNEEILGIQFSYPAENEGINPAESEGINNFLQAILSGADPTTGEILSEDSAWRHPKIIADIQEVLNENEN